MVVVLSSSGRYKKEVNIIEKKLQYSNFYHRQ